MDAHVFRRLCDALKFELEGARLEKIQSPAPGVHYFSFYNIKGPFQLVMRAERKAPFLFTPSARLSVGGKMPPAEVMRLRKYLGGRRVAACMADWTARRLGLLFHIPPLSTGGEGPGEIWLVLDLRDGPKLLLGRSPDMPDEPLWPEPQILAAGRENTEIFKEWPVLTPALRRVAPHLDLPELAALLGDLADGGGNIHLYQGRAEDDVLVSAWPLPEALRAGRVEKIYEDPLAALDEAGMRLVMGGLALLERKKELAPLARSAARFERVLRKLDEEEQRLRAMTARKEEARLLQDNLWRLTPALKKPMIILHEPEGPARTINLDPKLTVLENMRHIFHQAARGARGLEFVARRRAAIKAELAAAGLPGAGGAEGPGRACSPANGGDVCEGPGAGRKKIAFAAGRNDGGPEAGVAAAAHTGAAPRGVAGFRSLADGRFILWRGRDAKGNSALIKAAAPHDVWLHVEGGPGAHVLIRRDHQGQEIPEAVWLEAGVMAAEKSWRKDDGKASIMCALARHVRPVKGGEPGAARVDKILKILMIDLEKAAFI